MLDNKRAEFARLFHEFAYSYPLEPEGLDHIKRYEEQRTQGQENFTTIDKAARRGEDVAEQVLLKLLPYNNFPAYRQKGAWIHVAPTPGDPAARIKSKWPEDWPQSAQAILRFVQHCNEHLGDLYKDQGLVFTTGAGTLINPSNLRQRSLAPLLKRAGVPQITFHDLRHTCASLLFQRNVHPKFVQELLGHANVAITLDTYSHMLPGMGSEAADAMEDALSGDH